MKVIKNGMTGTQMCDRCESELSVLQSDIGYSAASHRHFFVCPVCGSVNNKS